jgi:putative ABC transport system substrate-binding protein
LPSCGQPGDLIADLVRLRVDAIVSTWSTPAALATKKATSTIPIVFAGVGDAVGVGVVESLTRPGGNVAGSTFVTEETIGKQLELLKAAVPRLARVGMVINPINPVYGSVLRASEAPARALGLQLDVVSVQSADDFERAFRAAVKRQVDGLVVLRDAVLVANQPRLLTLTASAWLPAMYGVREFVDSGGLMSYGPSLVEMYRRAGYPHGQDPEGRQAGGSSGRAGHQFELVINLQTAKALGLAIPQSLLERADQVIE